MIYLAFPRCVIAWFFQQSKSTKNIGILRREWNVHLQSRLIRTFGGTEKLKHDVLIVLGINFTDANK